MELTGRINQDYTNVCKVYAFENLENMDNDEH